MGPNSDVSLFLLDIVRKPFVHFGFLDLHLGHGPRLQEGGGRKWQFIPTLLVGWRHLHRKPWEAQATGCCSGSPQGPDPRKQRGRTQEQSPPSEVCPAGGRTSGNAGSALALVPSERPGVIWGRRPSLHRRCHLVPHCPSLRWAQSSFAPFLASFFLCSFFDSVPLLCLLKFPALYFITS